MDTAKPDLSQPELPPPNEKLLRAPTFFEKYHWMKTVIIVALIVLVIDAAIYYVLRSENQDLSLQKNTSQQTTQPSTMPTQNWPTYVSEQGGFMINYPTGGIIRENTTVAPYGIQLTSPTIPELDTTYRLSIVYKPALQNQSLHNLIAQNKLCPNIAPENALPSTINGEKNAAIYIDAQCGPLVKTVIYTLNNNLFYMITIETQAKFTEIKPYTDQVLSTLRFMDPMATDAPLVPSQVMNECTADALLCADGSSVGRTGPNCEFAACPKP